MTLLENCVPEAVIRDNRRVGTFYRKRRYLEMKALHIQITEGGGEIISTTYNTYITGTVTGLWEGASAAF